MRTIEVNIPDDLDMKDFDFLMFTAAKLYEEKKLTSGQASRIVGISKKTFIELLGKYGVSIFSDSVSELHADISNA